MRRVLPFTFIYLIPALALLGIELQGPWLWVTPLFSFLIIPMADRLVGDEYQEFQEPSPLQVSGSRWLVVIYVPLQLALVLESCRVAASSHWVLAEWVAAGLSLGLATGGIGITLAHELVHRTESHLRTMGGALLSMVFYGHFMVEHVYGHHTWVATKKDPATARLGENLYTFYVRTLTGSWTDALKIESEWRKKKNLGWHHNRILLTFASSFILGGLIFHLWGWLGLGFFVLQAWVALTLLEIINYVEHYGLSRKEISPGIFEPVANHHSWDSRRRISNWFLINLEHHSDHHKYPLRDFLRLRFHENAPLLPAGYPEMIILALIPPLWFRLMNKRLKN